jgi:hypothetical protein
VRRLIMDIFLFLWDFRLIGSLPVVNTIGIVEVTAFAACSR